MMLIFIHLFCHVCCTFCVHFVNRMADSDLKLWNTLRIIVVTHKTKPAIT